MSFTGICIGCMVAYGLGATLLKDWALELQRRNPIFEALDLVLETKGLTVSWCLKWAIANTSTEIVLTLIADVAACILVL